MAPPLEIKFPQMYASEHDPPATAEPLKLLQ